MVRKKAKRLDPVAGVELEMTPMIDVTFLLLVFFLCTLRFKTLEGKLATYLPKDVGGVAEPADRVEPITVELRVRAEGERRDAADPSRAWSGAGRYRLVGRELAVRVGPRSFASVDAAAERVRALRAADPGRDVELDVDAAAIHADAVGLLDALRAVGVADVTLIAPPD